MELFDDFINELNKIVEKSNTAREIIERINENKILNLENDIGEICTTIKILKNDLFKDFVQELINQGKIHLLKRSLAVGVVNDIFKVALELKDPILTEFIGKNFKQLVSLGYKRGYIDIQNIKPFMLNFKFKEQVINGIPTAIKNMWIIDRMKLIDIINNSDGQLGNIENYLSDFLYVPDGKELIGIENILLELEKIESLDKIKLLQGVNNNIQNLINSFGNNSKFRITSFFDTIKRIEDALSKDTEEERCLINEVNNTISDSFESVLKKHKYNIDLVNSLRQFNIDNSKFKEIQNDIVDQLYGVDLVRYIQSTKGNENFHKDWDALQLTKQLFKNSEEVTNDEVLQATITKLLEELCEHENVEIKDIEYAGSGFFNFNIKIGKFVLKLGKNVKIKGKNEIPYDKRILKPIIRQFNNPENKQGVANIYLEVQNLVDDNWYIGLSEGEIKEQLYVVYKDLRDRGKRWTDIKPENVGRLLRPNKENFEIETLNQNSDIEKTEIKSNNYAIGFTGEEPDEILGIGELVVIDIDRIYKENDEYAVPIKSYYNEFEERYQHEKKFKQTNNIKSLDIKNIIKGEYSREDIQGIEKEIKIFRKNLSEQNSDISKGE